MNALNRREFLRILERVLGLIGLSAIALPVIAYFYPTRLEEIPSEPVLVGSEADLPPNTSKTVRFGRYPALVLNTPSGLRAYSAVCTHFGCIVKWDADKNQIACPCHDGFFDPADGSVIAGPPPEALMTLSVQVKEGQIYVGGGGAGSPAESGSSSQ
jgi:cytochrome b6-f complex iron-sulfur subunit